MQINKHTSVNMEAIDTPVCVSQYFVNRQNVRSCKNITKWNVLKNSSEKELCEMLFNGEFQVSDLTSGFLQILTTIKTNLINKGKSDFREYFTENKTFHLIPLSKELVFNNCWKVLCDIIPSDFFTCNINRKIFKHFTRSVIYSMKKHHFVLEKYMKRWDTSVLPWKNLVHSRKMLNHLFKWILKYILTPIVCLNFHVTTCKLDSDENKLYYFWKNEWQSFYDKQISKMVYTKLMIKSEPYSLIKKSRCNYNPTDKLKFKLMKKKIPKLHLTLKPNNEYRPIVSYKNNLQTTGEKYKVKDRLRFLRLLAGSPVIKIEDLHKSLYRKWLAANKPKLYFIKTDLSNAFGCINREKLAKILSERYIICLKTESCTIKKQRIIQQFKDVVTELRKPILVRAGSTVYEWKEGLVQGYKYSPALSELYYNYMDEKYFSTQTNNIENQVKLFIRVVDDYLYITNSIEDAVLFLKSLSNYRNVNFDKTMVNFKHDNIKFNKEITFLGYSYNTGTMEVARASNIYTGQMCYKIAFTSGLSDVSKFIDSRIGQSGNQISSHVFNLLYNSEELVWSHIFTAFCISANKFCTILAVLDEEEKMNDYLPIYKKRVTVKLTMAMLDTLLRNKTDDYIFVYCINHFRYLSWQALCLCAQQTPKCSELVPQIKVQLAKSNCLFSVWRDHASRIDTHGNCQRKAVKEVCRRLDLRMIFRNFVKLPEGLECYHHKR